MKKIDRLIEEMLSDKTSRSTVRESSNEELQSYKVRDVIKNPPDDFNFTRAELNSLFSNVLKTLSPEDLLYSSETGDILIPNETDTAFLRALLFFVSASKPDSFSEEEVNGSDYFSLWWD